MIRTYRPSRKRVHGLKRRWAWRSIPPNTPLAQNRL